MKSKVKSILRTIIPSKAYVLIQRIRLKVYSLRFDSIILKTEKRHLVTLKKLRNKQKIKVAFFLIHHADWKYEGVYRLMANDDRFEPVVFVCPYVAYGDEFMFKVMNQAYVYFKKDGYKVIKSWDEKKETWIDVKNSFQPDIVFFTSPWNITRPEYLIETFPKTLTCYVPYGYETSHLFEAYYNRPMQNLVWRFFIENETHKKLSEKYSKNHSRNVVVSGYPGMDRFSLGFKSPIDVWKQLEHKPKRIIWAPHHSIEGKGASLDYSTFLTHADQMIDLVQKYFGQIQIAFKPHPILRMNLNNDNIWGKKRTDEYYKKWEDLPNGQLIEGDYLDLFFTSDGLIHDCGSFVAEYMYTGKPVLYLFHDENITDRFNEVGKMAISSFYHGRKLEDIEIFISEVIIGENDQKFEARQAIFNKIIKVPNHLTASENIVNHIKSELFDQRN